MMKRCGFIFSFFFFCKTTNFELIRHCKYRFGYEYTQTHMHARAHTHTFVCAKSPSLPTPSAISSPKEPQRRIHILLNVKRIDIILISSIGMIARIRMTGLARHLPFLPPVVGFQDNQIWWFPVTWHAVFCKSSASPASTHFPFSLHSFSHPRTFILYQSCCLFSLYSSPALGTRRKHLQREFEKGQRWTPQT